MNSNDLPTDNELLILFRKRLEARNITGSDHVLNSILEGVMHRGIISYDIGDILYFFEGKCIEMKEAVVDNWNINDHKSLLDAVSDVSSFVSSPAIQLHISFPCSIEEDLLYSLTPYYDELLRGKIQGFNVWQREVSKLCVRYFYCK